MRDFWARTVLFVSDATRAREFYKNELGFALDWTHEERGLPYVFQVSLHGLQIILNQTEDQGEEPTNDRPGHGRIFIGLDEEQAVAFFQHVQSRAIPTTFTHWGAPTMVIHDLDGNELFFWMPDSERLKFEALHAAN